MIQKLNHQDLQIAEMIYDLRQVSYAVEAELLQAEDFPPLKRSVEEIRTSDTTFYALYRNNEPAAIVEIKHEKNRTHTCSLVVHPQYFRQGLGRELMSFVLRTRDSELFTVETGLDNVPAIRLYEKLGFREVGQYDTPFGVRKIKLEMFG